MPYILPHETHHEHAGHAQDSSSSPTPPTVQQHVPFPSTPQHAHTDDHPTVPAHRESRSCSLRSSLKPSDGQSRQSSPRRAQSAPAPPPKLVHFPSQECDLQSVRVFKLKGKPAAISAPEAEETETETEGYDSTGSVFARPTFSQAISETYAVDGAVSSPVPKPSPDEHAHVHLETLQLPQTRPLTLCGSVLVRNVAYSKTVAARFSLDGWVTTSEVNATYVMSLSSIPPPFHSGHGDADPWDRFTFHINLSDKHLRGRTLSLAIRYQVEGGEWWDNNDGRDYSVAFTPVESPTVDSPLTTHWPAALAVDRIPRTSSPLSFTDDAASTPRAAPNRQPRASSSFLVPPRRFHAPWSAWSQRTMDTPYTTSHTGYFLGGPSAPQTLSVI